VWDPANFIPLFTTHYLPDDPTGGSIASRTKLIPAFGVLAHNVAAVEINWDVAQFLNGYSLYDEIEINGTQSASFFTPVAPAITSTSTSGGNLIITGAGGTPNASFTWLTTADLTPPVSWTPVIAGALDGTGSFSNAIPIITTNPAAFYRLQMP